jgi:hypothetical protein
MARMKNIILTVLLIILVGEGITLYMMNEDESKERVLAEETVIPTITPTETPTIIPTITPTPTPKPTPTIQPSSYPTIQPISSQQINEYVNRYAGQYGVSPDVIRHVALCESGFNPLSRSPNGLYTGLFQFSASAWVNYRGKMGEDTNADLRTNAEEAVQTAAYVISIGKGTIWPNCMP